MTDKKTTKRATKKTTKRATKKAVPPTLPEVQPKVEPKVQWVPHAPPAPKAKPAAGPDYDAVFDAVRLEELERGETAREACARAEDVCERLRLSNRCETKPTVPFYDLRSEQDYVYPNNKNKSARRGGSPVRRQPHEVDSIVIHQTAVEFSAGRRRIEAADGDENLALARRALDVACHAMAFRRGFFVAAHELDIYVNHGNRFNNRSLGLEIDGRYPGLMDDPTTAAREDLKTTWKGNPTELSDLTVKTACAALAWLVKAGRQAGMPIQFVLAHRQSSMTRRSDPGEELWKRVVLGFAVEELDLKTEPNFGVRGRPIPKEWDSVGGIGKY